MEQKDLRALEELCIQECAPPCTAACPIHVDARAVLLDFGKGDVDAALKTLRRTVPFPGIVGRICEQPCRAVCNRGKVGGDVKDAPIEIAALERACVDYGVVKAEKNRAQPKRNKHVAIVGGGLSGLTAAHDLARKGYVVAVYEALDPLGGRLWSYPEDRLPHAMITAELSVIETLGVEVHLNTPIGEALTLDELRDHNEAVYLAAGAEAGATFGLALDATGRIAVDPVTFATSRDGVFAGGSLLRGRAAKAIDSIADGRRAAISIDRYLQNVSLTASRIGEGSVESCLYTRTDDVASAAIVQLDTIAGYSRADAGREAARCFQCECMECVKVCEYLAHYKRYPRKLVREVYNNLSIVKGTRYSNQMINACSLCGLCAEVCPTDLDTGAINQQARETMVAQKRMPPSAHDFALRDMAFSRSDAFAAARNAPGTTTSDVVFFPGCQLSSASPEQVERVYAYLGGALPAETRLGLLLGCCGAPADWAGRKDLFAENQSGLREQLKGLGNPKVVLACSSCMRSFKAHLPEVEVLSLWDLMAERGLPAGAQPGNGRVVNVHDACATRHEAGLQDNVRALLDRLGYAVEELPRSKARTTCCGYGGVQWLADPVVADKVIARRVEEGSADYVAYCAMCRDFLARGGKPTVHLLDLIFGTSGADFETAAERPALGWSQRHENRARLKRDILAKVWGEPMDGLDPIDTIRLIVSAEVRARLEKRLILDEDMRRVIAFAERTGRRLVLPESGHFLATHKPVAVTYWIEYAPVGDAYEVFNAYSHRMEIVEDHPNQGQSA